MNKNSGENSNVPQSSECHYPRKHFEDFLSSSFLANKTKALPQCFPYFRTKHTPFISTLACIPGMREFGSPLYKILYEGCELGRLGNLIFSMISPGNCSFP